FSRRIGTRIGSINIIPLERLPLPDLNLIHTDLFHHDDEFQFHYLHQLNFPPLSYNQCLLIANSHAHTFQNPISSTSTNSIVGFVLSKQQNNRIKVQFNSKACQLSLPIQNNGSCCPRLTQF